MIVSLYSLLLMFLLQDSVMPLDDVEPQHPVACARRRFANEIQPKSSFEALGKDLNHERFGCISFSDAGMKAAVKK